MHGRRKRLPNREQGQGRMPHFAAAVGARHYGQTLRAFQTNRDVTEFGERLEVAPWPTAKIEDFERRFIPNVLQECRDVLADVVIACPLPELFRILVVMFQREVGDFFQILRIPFHVQCSYAKFGAAGPEFSRVRARGPTHPAKAFSSTYPTP